MKIKCAECLLTSEMGYKDAITVFNGTALCKKHLDQILKQIVEAKEKEKAKESEKK